MMLQRTSASALTEIPKSLKETFKMAASVILVRRVLK